MDRTARGSTHILASIERSVNGTNKRWHSQASKERQRSTDSRWNKQRAALTSWKTEIEQ